MMLSFVFGIKIGWHVISNHGPWKEVRDHESNSNKATADLEPEGHVRVCSLTGGSTGSRETVGDT